MKGLLRAMKRLFKSLFDLTRLPLGLMATASALAVALLVMQLNNPTEPLGSLLKQHSLHFLVGVFIPISVVSGANSLNDYYDYEADRANGRTDRPLVRNDIGLETTLALSIILLLVGVVAAIILGYVSGNWLVTLFVLFFAFISVSYSTWLKKYGFWGNVGVALSYPAPLFLGGLLVGYNDPLVFLAMSTFAFVIFINGLGRELLKGIMDMSGDAKEGIITIAVRYGPKFASAMAFILFLVGTILTLIPFMVLFSSSLGSAVSFVIGVTTMTLCNFYSAALTYRTQDHNEGRKARFYTKIGLWGSLVGGVGASFFLL